jgi:hypothetical protein
MNFNMKMMFNGLDRQFELLNSKYGREAQKILSFAKHHNITIYIEREKYLMVLQSKKTVIALE